jgi:hypothetical protein
MHCTDVSVSLDPECKQLELSGITRKGAGKENAYEKKESEDADLLEAKDGWRISG